MNKIEILARIRKALETCKDPLFFYDDDPDGLASFLLLYKFAKKGKGIVLKVAYGSDEDLILRKIDEYKPDSVFILDRAVVDQDIVDQINIPTYLIDHHGPQKIQGATYFNPLLFDPKDSRPTSYWCYKVVKENLWIAMTGTVADWCVLQDLKKDFIKSYPGYLGRINDPAKALHETKVGQLARIFWFCLKGKTSQVNKCINTLVKIDDPKEILEQTTPRGKYIYKYYAKINRNYETLLHDAEKCYKKKDPLLVFTYTPTSMSLTAILANELLYKYPEKIIIIARQNSDKVIMSLRSAKHPILSMLKIVLGKVNGYGGGHTLACGATVDQTQFKEFIRMIRESIKKR
ncbi:MAG: DHH family phosphoesterase [archaeon]